MVVFIIDTNVAVVANGRDTHASLECQLGCVKKLAEIKQQHKILIDDQRLILQEYHRRLNIHGQPGTGDMFYRYVFDNQGIAAKVQKITITPDANGGFVEFPNDPDLAGFDSDDKMFVAVAIASSQSPTILNAVDSDWAENHEALQRHSILVEELCPT